MSPRKSFSFILLFLAAGVFGSAAMAAAPVGCVDILSVDAQPQSVCPGGSVLVTVTFMNCGSHMDNVTVSVTAMGPDGGVLRSGSQRLCGGQTGQFTSMIDTSPTSTPGMWSVTANASSRRGGSDSSANSFAVVSCP